MTETGIPVLGHLGLTTQHINKFGTSKTRGTDKIEADKIFADAVKLEDAGAFSIVLEKIPAELAKAYIRKFIYSYYWYRPLENIVMAKFLFMQTLLE